MCNRYETLIAMMAGEGDKCKGIPGIILDCTSLAVKLWFFQIARLLQYFVNGSIIARQFKKE